MHGLDTQVLQQALASQATEMEPDTLRRILHAQLQTISPESRERSCANAVAALNALLPARGVAPLPPPPATDQARFERHLREMRETGITLLGPILNKMQLEETHRHLNTRNVYGSHVWTFSDRNARPKAEVKETHGQACYRLDDILAAPHLLETMSDPFVLRLVEQYLGCVPTVFQSNLMWSFEKRRSQPNVAQSFHRDWDNFRFCVLFVYMTDVDADTGPHEYIRGSHTTAGVRAAIERYHASGGRAQWANVENFYREAKLTDTQIQELFGNAMLRIEQPAGYAFLSDAFGLHRGVPLVEGERLLFWTRYGLYDNGFSVDVSPAPVARETFAHRMPDDMTHRYIFRSVLQSEFSPTAPPSSLHPSGDEFAVQSDALIARFGKTPFVRKAARLVLDRLKDRLKGRR